MNEKTLLLIEDDVNVQLFNKGLFEGCGFNVITALTIAGAKAALAKCKPDAIILDINLPDGSGLEFLAEFRQTSRVPVLLLTGHGEDEDIIEGFRSGCNDYMSKPYTFDVLLVRLNNLLQGAERMPEAVSVGSLTFDMLSNRAFINDEDLNLTDREFSLIRLLVKGEGKVMSADDVYEKVWGQPMLGDKNALQVAITRLRKKIEPAGYSIISMRGAGYVFVKG